MGRKNKSNTEKKKYNLKIKTTENETYKMAFFNFQIAFGSKENSNDIELIKKKSECEIVFDKMKFNLFNEANQDRSNGEFNLLMFNKKIIKNVTEEKINLGVCCKSDYYKKNEILNKEFLINLKDFESTIFFKENFPFFLGIRIEQYKNEEEFNKQCSFNSNINLQQNLSLDNQNNLYNLNLENSNYKGEIEINENNQNNLNNINLENSNNQGEIKINENNQNNLNNLNLEKFNNQGEIQINENNKNNLNNINLENTNNQGEIDFNENQNNLNKNVNENNQIISIENSYNSSVQNNHAIQLYSESTLNMDYIYQKFLKLEDGIKTLQDENIEIKEELRKTKEELKDTKEELRKTKEELKDTKEELRKTKEDLKDTKEELRKTKEDVKGIKETLAMITYRYMLDLFADEIHIKDENISKTQKVRNIFYAIYQKANNFKFVQVWDYALKKLVKMDCRPFVMGQTLDNLEISILDRFNKSSIDFNDIKEIGNLYHTESKLFHYEVKPDNLKVYFDLNMNYGNNKAKAALPFKIFCPKEA